MFIDIVVLRTVVIYLLKLDWIRFHIIENVNRCQ